MSRLLQVLTEFCVFCWFVEPKPRREKPMRVGSEITSWDIFCPWFSLLENEDVLLHPWVLFWPPASPADQTFDHRWFGSFSPSCCLPHFCSDSSPLTRVSCVLHFFFTCSHLYFNVVFSFLLSINWSRSFPLLARRCPLLPPSPSLSLLTV